MERDANSILRDNDQSSELSTESEEDLKLVKIVNSTSPMKKHYLHITDFDIPNEVFEKVSEIYRQFICIKLSYQFVDGS